MGVISTPKIVIGPHMSTLLLDSSQLRITIPPASLGFADTSELLQCPLSWIGQDRAETATRFGLNMDQPDYHLFVLGEIGSGRSSLLQQAMIATAADKTTPPDLCYLHNFAAPEKPLILHVPAGQGQLLRQSFLQLTKTLAAEIISCLSDPAFKITNDRLEKKFEAEITQAYTQLDKLAELRHFALHRENERIIFKFLDEKGEVFAEKNLLKLPQKRRIEIERAEQELHEASISYFEAFNRIDKERNIARIALQRRTVQSLLNLTFKKIQSNLPKPLKDNARLEAHLEQIESDILDNLALFAVKVADEEKRQAELNRIFSRYQINLVVDNANLRGAPVIIEDNPCVYTLFGGIDYQFEDGKLTADFMHIRAGNLLKAHGGFLLLHLSDLLADEHSWLKLRRFLRCGRLQIESCGSPLTGNMPLSPLSLQPETIAVNVKIVLIGSREDYYALLQDDPEFMRRFRVKVDFAESFLANAATYQASAVYVAHTCNAAKLPHFSAAAVAYLLEESHREVEDQKRQSAILSHIEMLVLESAALCHARSGHIVEVDDIETAIQAHILRHNYADLSLQEAIIEDEISITLQGARIGQINALMQIDLGDHRLGMPIRITARTFAGEDGVLNIAREVEMSGPIHDKGMMILQNYLTALFAHIAPLALSASIVFEQEYTHIEGDSASCAEFYALLSSLAELPLNQSIAVTGAMNQFGEVLPIGGINDKIEGYFNLCKKIGLNGEHGVLIPHRNRHHLMLNHKVIAAVEEGLFNIYTMEHVIEGLELLTNFPAGSIELGRTIGYSSDTVLGSAQKALLIFRRACQMSHHPRTEHRRLPSRSENERR
jgi:predicted ATP-dependent protease